MLLSGILTRRQRRVTRRPPESNRKRKLGGNAGDHRPYFTYWITFVQVLVLFISTLTYGVGPIGIDLYKKAGMVSHQVHFFLQTNRNSNFAFYESPSGVTRKLSKQS